jgi:hypothetical protein
MGKRNRKGDAMKIQTFVGKVDMEALKQMDEHINEWLACNKIEPKQIQRVFGYERHPHHHGDEPVLVTSVWY